MTKNGALLQRQTELFVKPKYFEWQRPTISVEAKGTYDGVENSFTTDVFAKYVFVDFDEYDITLSDNYFDLTGKEAYTVTAKTKCGARDLKEHMLIKSVYDIGK